MTVQICEIFPRKQFIGKIASDELLKPFNIFIFGSLISENGNRRMETGN